MELRDRNIVITGAGSGIGRALAQRFAAEQPRGLVVADVNLPAVEAVAEEDGGLAVQADVRHEADIRTLVDRPVLLQRGHRRPRRWPGGIRRGAPADLGDQCHGSHLGGSGGAA